MSLLADSNAYHLSCVRSIDSNRWAEELDGDPHVFMFGTDKDLSSILSTDCLCLLSLCLVCFGETSNEWVFYFDFLGESPPTFDVHFSGCKGMGWEESRSVGWVFSGVEDYARGLVEGEKGIVFS